MLNILVHMFISNHCLDFEAIVFHILFSFSFRSPVSGSLVDQTESFVAFFISSLADPLRCCNVSKRAFSSFDLGRWGRVGGSLHTIVKHENGFSTQ